MAKDGLIMRLLIKYRVLLMYGLVGCGTVPINWGVYSLCVEVVGFSIFWANAAAWLFSSLFAYFGNKRFVFCSDCWEFPVVAAELSTFFGIRAVSTVFELAVQPILVHKTFLGADFLGVRGLLAKMLVSVVVIIMNFVLSRWLVFGRWIKHPEADQIQNAEEEK